MSTDDAVPADYDGDELRALSGAKHYQEWIAEQFRPYLRGTLMEIGTGIGTMAQKWLGHVERLHLVEPAPNLYPVLQARFGGESKVRLYSGTLEQVLSRGETRLKEVADEIRVERMRVRHELGMARHELEKAEREAG